ncbi:MAG: ATPase [Alphaproteobacteria bacterium]|nr:MAG: ATPase [Alphaproteobacteria bacterium]
MSAALGQQTRLGYVVSVAGSRVTGVLANADAKSAEAAQAQVGVLVKILTGRSYAFGMVNALAIPTPSSPPSPDDVRVMQIDLFGEMMIGAGGEVGPFQRGCAIMPSLGQPIFATTAEDLVRVYARPSNANVRVGTIHQDPDLPAYIRTDDMLGRHFAVLGTTGAGKSCAVALLLRAILTENPAGHVVLVDPHNEYAAAFGDQAEVVNIGNLQLPHWLLNFEEISSVLISPNSHTAESEAAILADAILQAKSRTVEEAVFNEHLTIDTPVPYRLSELARIVDDAMGKLNKADGATPYLRLKAKIESLRSDRRFSFMFSGLTIHDVMANVIGRFIRVPVEGKPVTIIDLSGVPSEIVDVVVSVLVRMVFDFAVWADRASSIPVLLVCEEAHRYVPRDQAAGFGPTRRALARIAKEGRKYGVSLGLVTQRPAEISETILSQCNTLFAMRMSNEQDQHFVQKALPEAAAGLINTLPALRPQEAIAVGEGVVLPMRIRFDDLAPEHRPHSQGTAFSEAWQQDHTTLDQVAETIHRWRRQSR